jgi:hypothetical protein
MELIVFEKEAYYKMLGEITTLVKNSIKEAKLDALKAEKESDWINADEAKKLLNVKSKTKMQQMRNSGEIVFTKYGKKIKYSKKSILAVLDNHKVA